ncbi:MAG: hypothetical protein GEU79_04010 [Acidimicrobiia bacterium]|nr:hypothetical protein [Acidimicrobiia bacterium]
MTDRPPFSEIFGPLNGIRIVLVAAAFVAAVVSAFTGRWLVASILFAGVVGHLLGWLFLYRKAMEDRR